MRKYEEEHYKYENIKDSIYPWVKKDIWDSRALNGKSVSLENAVVIDFVGELHIIFAIKRGEEIYEILKDNMLSPEVTVEELYHAACENLARDVEFVIANTFYGAFGILADGIHEASSICLKHIWQVCVDKLDDDLVIAVPSKDTVLFAPASQREALEGMEGQALAGYEQGADKITMQYFLFSKARKELTVYEQQD